MAHVSAPAALALALWASAAFAQPGTPEEVGRGHDLVIANCSPCHATGQTDTSPNPLAPHFRDLHQRYPIEDLAEALAEGIIVGHPQMPELTFPPGDVRAIIAYLKSIQTTEGGRQRWP